MKKKLLTAIFLICIGGNVFAQKNESATSESNNWYIVYHRKPLGDKDGNHRVTCIDRMYFNENGLIEPIEITFEGVSADKLH